MISDLAVKELNAWRGERCSRLLAATEAGGQSGTPGKPEGELACRDKNDWGQKEGTHDRRFVGRGEEGRDWG